jgi:hypothetical protein
MKVKIVGKTDGCWYNVGEIYEVENRATESRVQPNLFLFLLRFDNHSGVRVTDCEIIEAGPAYEDKITDLSASKRAQPEEPRAASELTLAEAIEFIQEHMQESYTPDVGLYISPDDEALVFYGDRDYQVSNDEAEAVLNSIYALSKKEHQGE